MGGNQPQTPMTAAEGVRVSDELLVFISAGQFAGLRDRVAQVDLRAESATRVCLASGELTLADDDECIHSGEEPVCPEEEEEG